MREQTTETIKATIIERSGEKWQTIIYIRHLPPAGSLGEPCAYAGDEYDYSGSGNL